MYYSIYVKWKSGEEKVWLRCCHQEELKLQIACLLTINERENKIESITIKETDYE